MLGQRDDLIHFLAHLLAIIQRSAFVSFLFAFAESGVARPSELQLVLLDRAPSDPRTLSPNAGDAQKRTIACISVGGGG